MSAPETPTHPRPIQVQVRGEPHMGTYRVDAGVLTVWYGFSSKSIPLQKGPPAPLQAEMLLVDMLTSGSHRDD